MAAIQIAIPDTLVLRVRAAMRGTFPQHAELSDAATFKLVTADYWRSVLSTYEAQVAQDAGQVATAIALQAAIDKAAADGAGIG